MYGCLTKDRAVALGKLIGDNIPDGFAFVIIVIPRGPPEKVQRVTRIANCPNDVARDLLDQQLDQDWETPHD